MDRIPTTKKIRKSETAIDVVSPQSRQGQL